MLEVMRRSVVALVLAFSLGVLPVVHDVCGPECEMGETPVLVAFDAAAEGLASQDPLRRVSAAPGRGAGARA